MKNPAPITRKHMIKLLNQDLAREYQAIIGYIVYSQTMKGAKFQHIAGELERHAAEELSHALLIAKQIDYFNGTPVTMPRAVKLSDKAEDRTVAPVSDSCDAEANSCHLGVRSPIRVAPRYHGATF